ncbi:patatin-domain-containing protein [Schizopora paradoxa]|uniref:Lysophospholipase NTE1 n=1 Tax=Schizopora paradoxa TaxID=27342 RepID=A0A0H2RHI6_9AGAM|nr:patatin-domain-containing protein [Schizopora paradoxa]
MATAMEGQDAYQGGQHHPLVSLFAAVFWVLLWLLSWAKSLIAFATISIPRFIYAVLSYSLTFTLNFWSFVIIFILSAVALNYWIRFRYLNTYADLKEPPLVKPDAKELHPDVNATEEPPNFHNYLDDFLQAVRIFGFLEKPVFHELARHLQTRRLIAGDSLSLDQDKSFYCVVDGLVQVYTRTGEDADSHGTFEEDGAKGYQLLNEVGSGGTLSSLFTILSLFTEDVSMSWQDTFPDNSEPVPDITSAPSTPPARTRLYRSHSDVTPFDLDTESPIRARREASTSSSASASTVLPDSNISSPGQRSRISSGNLTSSQRSRSDRTTTKPINHGTIAVAVEDTTLAVIPAEAFKRLTKNFPKASAHIVQVILTRFSRVTINAAHRYLGLTTEVIRTEKAINDIANHPLPNSFYEGGGLQRLRQRVDRHVGIGSPKVGDADYFSSAQDSAESMLLTSDETSIPETPTAALPKESPSVLRTSSHRGSINAGDLHSMATLGESYRPFHRSFSFVGGINRPEHKSSLNKHEVPGLPTTDEFDLRDEVMSCIAKSIGLHQPPLSGSDSPEASPPQSPGQKSPGSQGRPPLFNSFGSLSLLETGDDMSSVTGESTAGAGGISGLDNEVEILFFSAGSTLARVGERHPGLFYVIDGILDISVPNDEHEKQRPSADSKQDLRTPSSAGHGRRESFAFSAGSRDGRQQSSPSTKDHKHLFTVKPGGIAGYLASLCGIPSFVEITAKLDTYVGFLPYDALERLLEKRPIVLLTLAKRLISLLSPLVLHIDASLDWMQVSGSQVLWRPGDASDSFYIVINGRLRAIDDNEETGEVKILREFGQGEAVGELDVITRAPRRNTVHAIRDTELVRMPVTLFNAISARNPQTTAQLLRTIAIRVREEVDSSSSGNSSELGRSNLNLKTIAILPVDRTVPVEAFSKKLHTALESIGAPTAYLNQASVNRHLGRHVFTRMGKLKVAGWLADQEQRYHTVLYVADSPVNSSWTQTCIRQADCVMVVGAGDDPSIGEHERLLLSIKTTARKELVLLHPDRSVIPGSTREWLKLRPWIHQHIHVELPGTVVPVAKPIPTHQDPAAVIALKNLKNLKDKFQSEFQKYRGGRDTPRPQRPPHMSDFARLARRICGKSVGLVLGGGGARGISHLGLIRALTEYGIPIDHIGGTSIGAFVGGLYAREGDFISSAARVKQFSGRIGNFWRMLSDLTYPIVAYTTGHEFNRAIYKAFYDLHIEDMWLPFYCNTTNILTSRMELHETGYAWRFIRASMTLVGLLPPLCDNGNMLVDGGYLDNLPVSAIFSMGAKVVFASDVGAVYDNSPRNFGDSVSGFWLLLNKWNPFSSTKNIPAITDIQSRLAYVSSVKTLEEAKTAKGCFYMALPVLEYGIMDFNKFEEIQKKGYDAAVDMLDKLEEEGKLSAVLEEGAEIRSQGRKKGRGLRRNSI